MIFREINIDCENHNKSLNTHRGESVDLLILEQVVHIVTIML
jgi:hypothetical protein